MTVFSNQQSREFRKLMRRLPACERKNNAEEFLLAYVGFESVGRKIWHYYRCRIRTKKVSKGPILLPELKKAFAHFKIEIDEGVLDCLLDSKLDRRNEKAARNLRNGMVHSWSKPDCDEAAKRLDDFKKCFDEVIDAIQGAL